MNAMESWLVPLAAMVVPVAIVAIIFRYVLEQRKLLHQERMAMIEKGLAPEDPKEPSEYLTPYSRTRTLHSGVITTAVGLALLVGLGSMGRGPWLLGGLIPLAVGLGTLITFIATSEKDDKE
jgi:hypothetical protein